MRPSHKQLPRMDSFQPGPVILPSVGQDSEGKRKNEDKTHGKANFKMNTIDREETKRYFERPNVTFHHRELRDHVVQRGRNELSSIVTPSTPMTRARTPTGATYMPAAKSSEDRHRLAYVWFNRLVHTLLASWRSMNRPGECRSACLVEGRHFEWP
ncbi:hypothetical protein Ae201684P_017385 [Aphanomyces euteiches]|uniref:Uncharacterized protein n=1 Tax=Aphanomyces euteiches TaxID=100861 RepID=A0A6G0W4I5_9STRA|nr:hypothetical protein Ae201684_018803 [Aphanomyces euteiches]KAH9051901.1 hypothetical protein Ae201684P_017381 [Aphanomyces euteiches]KAH9051905.1 hypothetical protein Ae201684P_017385 [Aphanomyces euteiches]